MARVAQRKKSAASTMRPMVSDNSSAAPGTLAGGLASMPEPSSHPVFVDVSQWFGREFVLEWKRPSIRDIYTVADVASKLMKMYPLWPEQLAVHVATLGACHVAPSPGGLAPGLFYAKIADREDSADLWQHLMGTLGREYPSLIKTSLPMVQELIDLCIQYLHRHPEELGHLSSDVMVELSALAARKGNVTNL